MHVCLLTSSRSLEVVFGGEEKFTLSLGEWLKKRGYPVTIVSRRLFGVEAVEEPCDVSSNAAQMESEPPRRVQLPYIMFVVSMLFTSLLFVLQIIAVNRRSKISIIHAQDTGYGGLPALIAARILRIPVVLSSHGIRHITISNVLKGFPARLALPWEYCLDVFTSSHADIVVSVSSNGKRYFSQIMPEGRVRTIPIGIVTSSFKASNEARHMVRKELGFQDEVLVGFVGRLAPEKNLFSLLEAFAKAARKIEKVRLVLIGAGPLDKKLRAFSREQGVSDRVVFAGIRHDVNRVLSALDIFALPSYTEGCPTSLLEAMASGRAIVASSISSIREIVSNDEAILVNPHNVGELEQAITLLSNDRGLRADLGRKAIERSKLYDVDRIYKQLVTLYKDLTALN